MVEWPTHLSKHCHVRMSRSAHCLSLRQEKWGSQSQYSGGAIGACISGSVFANNSPRLKIQQRAIDARQLTHRRIYL